MKSKIVPIATSALVLGLATYVLGPYLIWATVVAGFIVSFGK